MEIAMSRVLKIFIIFAGIVVLLTCVLRFTQDGFRYKSWTEGGELGSTIIPGGDSLLVFTRIEESDFLHPPIPEAGDRLITINGKPAAIDTLLEEIVKHPPGRKIDLEYIDSGSGDTLVTTALSIQNPKGLSAFVLAMFILRVLIALGFLITGFWAFHNQSDSGAVRALSLFCFSMASMVIVAFQLGYENMDTFTIPFLNILQTAAEIFMIGLGAFWLHLQLLFPRPRKFVLNHQILTSLLIYTPIVALLIAGAVTQSKPLMLTLIFLVLAQVIAGFIFLIIYSVKTRDNLEKRQTRLVLWGTGSGIFGFIFAIALIVIFRSWFAGLSQYFYISIFLFVLFVLLLSPLSFIYAFGKYRLLEVEGRIKRGTRYIGVTIILLAIFFGILYVVSGFLIDRVGGGSKAFVPAIALILAAGFTPVHRRIQSSVEKRIYPERDRLKSMLKDFLTGALATSNLEEFWSGIESELREALKVERVLTVHPAGKDERLETREGGKTPFERGGEFARALIGLSNSPMMIDEALASGTIGLSKEERKWFEDNGIAMVLSLVTHDRLLGFIAVGFKSSRDDFEPTDIEMMKPLISQMTVTAENLRLMAENIEKQRLENELSVARQVQEGLLPHSIPETPGLEIDGRSLSCLEVAGDYYDIIKLDENRTVLAIGDVSGKGAGAAMLMSNLQASIRTAVRIGSDLRLMMEQINNLIFDNTESHQFITFFAGIFDARSSRFTYVNAGHNPPLVVSADGGVRELYKGGLILGAMSRMKYEQEEIELEKGDLLFLYTDGFSEAENQSGGMYGEDRISEFIVKNQGMPVNSLLDKIGEEIGEFSEGVPARDDLTLLAARVV